MYPPVALNHHTWVNKTHRHFILYASRPHDHIKSQHVKYGSNLIELKSKYEQYVVLLF